VRFLLVSVVAVLALGLARCSEKTPGEATSGGGTDRPTIPPGDTGQSEPSAPTEPSEGGDSGTAELQPCDLLSSTEKATLDLGPGAEEEIGIARACQWQASGQHTITIGVFDDIGLDDVQSNGAKQPTTVGSHDAVQYAGPLDACAIAIGVTDTSRVDVSGVAGDDATRACSVAKQAAELVEPKLP
jgi:hypothetical protein